MLSMLTIVTILAHDKQWVSTTSWLETANRKFMWTASLELIFDQAGVFKSVRRLGGGAKGETRTLTPFGAGT